MPCFSSGFYEIFTIFKIFLFNFTCQVGYTCISLKVKHVDGIVDGSDSFIQQGFFCFSYDLLALWCLDVTLQSDTDWYDIIREASERKLPMIFEVRHLTLNSLPSAQ